MSLLSTKHWSIPINRGNITGGYKISGICGELTSVIIDCINYGL
nr:MAG TPA: hypothetical protein [Caudoviricetes sp.]